MGGFPGGIVVKNLPDNARHVGSIPGWGRSFGVGADNVLLYSCLNIQCTEEPDGLKSLRLQRIGHN